MSKFEITSEWLHDNKTKRGGYTESQLRCIGVIDVIGVDFITPKGWLKASEGKIITMEEKNRFEILARQGKTLKKSQRTDRYSTVRDEKSY